MRSRCYRCFRPTSLCFCQSIPRIANRTDVVILQHVGERFHPFNTARIVQLALERCRLFVGHNRGFRGQDLSIEPAAGLLYPAEDAIPLTEIRPADRPRQLVIVDGTWHQAKTMVRDIPQLQQLPRYRLTPPAPGEYRIRREPDAQSLSTLEAVVAALQVLEESTDDWERLLVPFREMIERQLSFPASHAAWRHNRKRQSRPRNIPVALTEASISVVVAYGESTPGTRGQQLVVRKPVNWVAQRLDTGERFIAMLAQPEPLAEAVLQHMRLSSRDLENGITVEEFRNQWSAFLQPHDVLVVYHPRTYQLLRYVEAAEPRCLALKSLYGKRHAKIRSLEALLAIEGVTAPYSPNTSRAMNRLQMAMRWLSICVANRMPALRTAPLTTAADSDNWAGGSTGQLAREFTKEFLVTSMTLDAQDQ